MTARHAVRWLAVATFAALLGCSGVEGSGGATDDPSAFGGSGPTTPGGSDPTTPGGSDPTTPGGSGPTTSGGSTGDGEVVVGGGDSGHFGTVVFIESGKCFSLPPTTREERGLRISLAVRCGRVTAGVTNASAVMVSAVTLTDTLTPSLTRRIDGPATHSDEQPEQKVDDGSAPTDPSESTTPDEPRVEPVRDIGEMLRVSSSGGACHLDAAETVTVTCAFGDLQRGESASVELAFDRVPNLEGEVRHAIKATGRI